MEQANGKPRRHFTPQQKYDILKDIERCATIHEGPDKHRIASSVYYKWKRQPSVGINESLRNTKPVRSPELKKLDDVESCARVINNRNRQYPIICNYISWLLDPPQGHP